MDFIKYERENTDMASDMITLDFEDGTVKCEVQGTFELNGITYIALIDAGDTDDVYIYRYKEYKDEFELIDVTDESEFEAVGAEYNRIMRGM